MDNALWAKRIADRIHTSESNIDAAIASIMDVVTEIKAAQVDMSVSAVSTNPTLDSFMTALTSLQAARNSTIAGHRRVEKLGDALGIRTTGVGYIKTPPGIDDGQQVAQAAVRTA